MWPSSGPQRWRDVPSRPASPSACSRTTRRQRSSTPPSYLTLSERTTMRWGAPRAQTTLTVARSSRDAWKAVGTGYVTTLLVLSPPPPSMLLGSRIGIQFFFFLNSWTLVYFSYARQPQMADGPRLPGVCFDADGTSSKRPRRRPRVQVKIDLRKNLRDAAR